jgi:hypothetical protein
MLLIIVPRDKRAQWSLCALASLAILSLTNASSLGVKTAEQLAIVNQIRDLHILSRLVLEWGQTAMWVVAIATIVGCTIVVSRCEPQRAVTFVLCLVAGFLAILGVLTCGLLLPFTKLVFN